MTQVKINIETAIRKMGNLKRGVFFRHSGDLYVKTSRMVHEGTNVCSNALRLKDGESVFVNISVEVEVFNEAEVKLK